MQINQGEKENEKRKINKIEGRDMKAKERKERKSIRGRRFLPVMAC